MKVLLDTNVYIVAALDLARNIESAEVKIIKAAIDQKFRVVITKELQEQIIRVAKRVGNKNWASRLIALIWAEIKPIFIPQTYYKDLMRLYKSKVPRKDLAIFVAALAGNVDYLVSENRSFIKEATKAQNIFKCLTPEEFVRKLKL